MIINGFGICYMLNVCVCVVLLSQPSSRVIINGFGMLYVKCLCVLSTLNKYIDIRDTRVF